MLVRWVRQRGLGGVILRKICKCCLFKAVKKLEHFQFVLVRLRVHFHALHEGLAGDLVLLLTAKEEVVECADLLQELGHLVDALLNLDFREVQVILFKDHGWCEAVHVVQCLGDFAGLASENLELFAFNQKVIPCALLEEALQ